MAGFVGMIARRMSFLEVSDLRKSFVSPDGGESLVVDVEKFSLAKGELCGMRGESGSGKTTFRRTGGSHLNPGFREIADRVASRLGVESKVTANGAGKGKLIIPFADEKDLRRIVTALGA